MDFNNTAIHKVLKDKYPNNKIDLNIVYEPSTMDMVMTIEVDSVKLNHNVSLSTVEELAPRLDESVGQILLSLICDRVDEYLRKQKG